MRKAVSRAIVNRATTARCHAMIAQYIGERKSLSRRIHELKEEDGDPQMVRPACVMLLCCTLDNEDTYNRSCV
jgi:hypothetical protein